MLHFRKVVQNQLKLKKILNELKNVSPRLKKICRIQNDQVQKKNDPVHDPEKWTNSKNGLPQKKNELSQKNGLSQMVCPWYWPLLL